MDLEKPGAQSTEDTSIVNAQLGHLANQEDHEVGKLESFRRYPWQCFWCLFSVWCVLLVSFENQAAGNVLGIPQFRKDFGSFYDGDYVLDANWQAAFNGGPVAS